MIDGYAFIDGRFSAIVVDDSVITKSDLIEWGWARGPVEVRGRPTTVNRRALGFPYVYSSIEELKKDVKSRQVFEYNGEYYSLSPISVNRNHGAISNAKPSQPYRDSPWEGFYWVNPNWKAEVGSVLDDSRFKIINVLPTNTSATNPRAIELIQAALSAPYDSQGVDGEVFRGQWITTGKEKLDFTLWLFNLGFDNYESIIERSVIPGVGYRYPIERLATHGEWPERALNAEQRKISFQVLFPNCELGSDFCVDFSVDTDERLSYELNRQYIWSTLLVRSVFFPEKIRRLPMPRFQPRTATDAISCHVMNRGEVKQFVEKLYTKDIYDKIKNMLYGDGAGNILSVKWFYGIRPALSTTQKRRITLGNVVLDISTPVFAGDFTQVYMGNVYVGGKFGDYRDYTNMRIQAYIPMVGIIDLDPSAVVGKSLHLIYTVNLTDGSAIVTLSTTAGGGSLTKTEGWYETDNIVFTTSITYGYEIPLNIDSIRSAALTVGEIAVKTVAGGAVGAIAGNIPGAVLGALAGATSTTGVQTTYSSGSLTPNSNVMGDFTPKLIRTYNEDVSGDISLAMGRPSGRVVKVGSASGYLKAAEVFGTPSSIMQHSDEIVNMLKEGIRIS